jgi:valyl-tRNA synthetase
MAKPNLYGDDETLKRSTANVVQEVLMAVLKLIHPFMPFVTEEIWERLPKARGSIMMAEFPRASEFLSERKALEDMKLVMEVITGVRNIRGEMNIPPGKKVNIMIEMPSARDVEVVLQNAVHIQNLAKVDVVQAETKVTKPDGSATAVFGRNQVHVLLKGMLDFEEERKRLTKEINKIQKDIEVTNKKLSNDKFIQNAPQEIVEGVRQKKVALSTKLERLNVNLSFLGSVKES